ncbi:30S ribosomal protein S6 [Metallumcola ferriviriculae]|uniref:Small ribosomal subunit protein bS6 n=1 Tax=Metallumcola ferriviriculae TaxID=3039180 RepID=A0AAU0UHY6_9FIRM|nr:30S ribosomal protein S6 [Desulfitibacteraceae bacterium MK1]
MRAYECLYLVRPDIEDEAYTALVEKFNGVITSGGGEIESVDEWGKRRLAYEVRDYRDGKYILVQFSSNHEVSHEMERLMRISDDVLRFMVTRREEEK